MSDAPRWEDRVQVSLMLAVGGVAAAASWAHVVSLAAGHRQGGWLSYADAAVIETAAVSSGLEVRRRRRTGQSTVFPLTVLVVAVVLSLAAQVAQAERSVWGWVLAAVPAVGFLVLVKIAVSRAVSRPEGDSHVRPTAQPTQHDQRSGLPAAGGSVHPSGDGPGRDVYPEGDQAAKGQRAAAAPAEVVLAGTKADRARVLMATGLSRSRAYALADDLPRVEQARAALNGHRP